MELPKETYSRAEQIALAIATGDNSLLPDTPQSRLEQILMYIALNGTASGGGGSGESKNINDNLTSKYTTWSSEKVNAELEKLRKEAVSNISLKIIE